MRVTKTVSDEVTGFGTPMLGPRGGGRGRGNPLPDGEEGGWKRKRSRPPTPRGLVGFRQEEEQKDEED